MIPRFAPGRRSSLPALAGAGLLPAAPAAATASHDACTLVREWCVGVGVGGNDFGG